MSDFPGLAAGTGSGVRNEAFKLAAEVLDRKILIVATYDPAKITVVDETPVLITSPEDGGSQFGFGFMAHRLALKSALSAPGIPTYIQPQAEAGGAVAADGEIDWTGTAGLVAGILAVYLSGDRYPVTVTTGMTLEELSDAVVATVNADINAPVIAAKTAVTFETTFTAKSKGPWGNDISIGLSIQPGDITPDGVVSVITDMANGAGLPVMANALNALGTGDDSNEAHFTALIHGYGQDSTTLDSISTYVGEGNDFTGLYAKTVSRPFYSIVGDVAPGSAGLTSLIAISDVRLEDRGDGFIGTPDSKSHPSEIAAQTVGHAETGFQRRATASVVGKTLIGVDPGAKANRWTSSYSDRDLAVRSGISPTKVDGGNVKLQNLVTFYRPANVPVASNGYREVRNVSVSQNILNSQKVFFSRDKWQDYDIVEDINQVTNPEAKKRARDRNALLDDVIALVRLWASIGWLYNAQFSIDKIKAEPSRVAIRGTGDGFDVSIPVVYSGIGNINNAETVFDVSFAVFTQ